MLDMFCPDAWKQRAYDGCAGADGMGAAVGAAVASQCGCDRLSWNDCRRTGGQSRSRPACSRSCRSASRGGGSRAMGRSACYDDAAKAAAGRRSGRDCKCARRADLRADGVARRCRRGRWRHRRAQSLLRPRRSRRTRDGIAARLSAWHAGSEAPEVRRANLPVGWAKPAFDVLQLEDYEWVTGERRSLAFRGLRGASSAAWLSRRASSIIFRGSSRASQDREQWRAIIDAAREADARGVRQDIPVGAAAMDIRDGVTLIGEERGSDAFDDVMFPIEIGAGSERRAGLFDQYRDQRERL